MMDRMKKRLDELWDRKDLVNKYLKLMDEQIENGDTEGAHYEADELLCKFLKELGMSEIVEKYEKVNKWYS